MSKEITPIKGRLHSHSASKAVRQNSNCGSKKKESDSELYKSACEIQETVEDSNQDPALKMAMPGSSPEMMESLLKMMRELTTTVNTIKTDMEQLKSSKSKLETIEKDN